MLGVIRNGAPERAQRCSSCGGPVAMSATAPAGRYVVPVAMSLQAQHMAYGAAKGRALENLGPGAKPSATDIRGAMGEAAAMLGLGLPWYALEGRGSVDVGPCEVKSLRFYSHEGHLILPPGYPPEMPVIVAAPVEERNMSAWALWGWAYAGFVYEAGEVDQKSGAHWLKCERLRCMSTLPPNARGRSDIKLLPLENVRAGSYANI